MEIEINGIKKQAAGKGTSGSGRNPEIDRILDQMRVDKEPPFSPAVMDAVRRADEAHSIEEKMAILGEVRSLAAEGMQYYANLITQPGKPKKNYELPIIALAAKSTYDTLTNVVRHGQAGNGPKELLEMLEMLTADVGGRGYIFDRGEIKEVKVNPGERAEEEPMSCAPPDDSDAAVKIRGILDRMVEGVKTTDDLRVKFVHAMIDDDPDALQLVELISVGEGHYVHKVVPEGAVYSTIDSILILFSARRLVETMTRLLAGNEVFKFLDGIDKNFCGMREEIVTLPREE